VIKKKEVRRRGDEEGTEELEVISNPSDQLQLSMIDPANPNEVNFNRKEKVTKAAFVGAYSEGAGSRDEQDDKKVTFRGQAGKSSAVEGEDQGQPGEGLAGTLTRSVAALSEEDPASKAHNSRRLTTKSIEASNIEVSQVMAEPVSQDQASPETAEDQFRSEEQATLTA
jgi:hypothetical protein